MKKEAFALDIKRRQRAAYIPYAILVTVLAVAMVLIGQHLPAAHYAWAWQVAFYMAWAGGLVGGTICLLNIWRRR